MKSMFSEYSTIDFMLYSLIPFYGIRSFCQCSESVKCHLPLLFPTPTSAHPQMDARCPGPLTQDSQDHLVIDAAENPAEALACCFLSVRSHPSPQEASQRLSIGAREWEDL